MHRSRPIDLLEGPQHWRKGHPGQAAGGLEGDGLLDAVAGQAVRMVGPGAGTLALLYCLSSAMQAAGVVLTGCPVALTGPLDRSHAPGWPGTFLA